MANTALPRAGRTPQRASRAMIVSGPPLPPGVAQYANSAAITTPRLFKGATFSRWSPSNKRKRSVLIPQHSRIMPNMINSQFSGKLRRRAQVSPPPSSTGISTAASRPISNNRLRFMLRVPVVRAVGPASRFSSAARVLPPAGVAACATSNREKSGDACPPDAAPDESPMPRASAVHAGR